MKTLPLAFVLAVTLAGAAAFADGPPPPDARDPIAQQLYPPELVMSRQSELGLDEKQREAMIKEIQATQARITELSWQMQGAVEQLVLLLGGARLDEAKVLAQADKVMGLEREVKRTHLTLLVRMKNLLTPPQRAKLDEIRRTMK